MCAILLILTSGFKKRGEQNKGNGFWNGGLRHLLHTSNRGSGKGVKKSLSAIFLSWQKQYLLNVHLTYSFKPWLLDCLDLPMSGSELNKEVHPDWCPRFTMVLGNGQSIGNKSLSIGNNVLYFNLTKSC